MIRLLHRIDVAARQAIPLALVLLLVLLSTLPAPLPLFREAAPAWVLIAVFHWSVYRPDLMPVQGVFFAGLLQDLLLGLPPGSSALLYVLVRGSSGIVARHATGRSFPKLWLLFSAVAAAAALLRYLIMMLWHVRLIDPTMAMLELMLTIGAFPLAAWVLMRLQKGLLAHV
ncbi:MAG: rod shape-determining protein MreD [Alphaproteobacteria bacterium]